MVALAAVAGSGLTPAVWHSSPVQPGEAEMGAPVRGYLAPAIFPSMTATPTATPSPVPTPTPQPAPLPVVTVSAAAVHGAALTEAEFDALLAQTAWPRGLWPQVKTVAWCESKWSPGAHGDGGNSLGLFQIGVSRPGWQGWFQYFGEDESLAYDPLKNAQVAWRIYQYGMDRYGYGWGPWSCKPIG